MRNKDLSVAIVITTYNYGQYIAEAIESALAQSHRVTEVLVIDDGSTDNTKEVVGWFSNRIKYFNQKNSGVAAARNNGSRKTTAKYICFLDADDKLDPSYISELLDILERNPECSFAYCSAQKFGAESGIERGYPYSVFILLHGNYINASALMKRQDFLEIGGYDEDFCLKNHEDWDLWLKFAQHGKSGVYLPKPLLFWRRHSKGSRNILNKPDYWEISWKLKRKYKRLYHGAPVYLYWLLYKIYDMLHLPKSEKIIGLADKFLLRVN